MAEEVIEQTNEANLAEDPEMAAMAEAGVFYGRTKQKTYPRMRPYILTTRNGIEIINLGKTLEKLEEAMAFVKIKVAAKAPVLLVGAQPAAADGITKLVKEFNIPGVSVRWLGGTLTNFKVISKRIEYFKKLKSDFAAGAFKEKYTKKEQLGIQKELVKLEELLSGLESMTVRPEVLVVIDPNAHKAAIREARRLGIPIVAYASTDLNPDDVDYLVPGNTKARTSVNWFLDKLAIAIREGQKEALAAAVPAEKPKQ